MVWFRIFVFLLAAGRALGAADTATTTGAKQVVVFTKSGSCYHLPWCPTIRNADKLYTKTLAQIASSDLRPCKVCNPPTFESLGLSMPAQNVIRGNGMLIDLAERRIVIHDTPVVAERMVYVNPHSTIYHGRWCKLLKSGNSAMPVSAAIQARYRPCTTCKP